LIVWDVLALETADQRLWHPSEFDRCDPQHENSFPSAVPSPSSPVDKKGTAAGHPPQRSPYGRPKIWNHPLGDCPSGVPCIYQSSHQTNPAVRQITDFAGTRLFVTADTPHSKCRQARPYRVANQPSDRDDPDHARDGDDRVDAGIFPHDVYRTLTRSGHT
jgi:hypothetical protein